MKYSVVIPLYNKEHYIEKTISSVLNQTFQDFEIIVIDDGSKDKSLSKARKLEKRSEKIRVIEQENQGVSVARNTGVEYAKGDYIAFLDADDEWRDNYLETMEGKKLPKMSGFDLLEKLQNEKISIPQTIIASACAMDEDKKKALEYNIDTYITKPIDINGFVKIVKEKLNV